MKVALSSSITLGLMSLSLLGPGCDRGPANEHKVDPDALARAEDEEAKEARARAKKAEADMMARVRAEADKPGADKPEGDKAAELAPRAASAPPTPGAPGPAFFAVNSGVVRLDGGKFTLLADSVSASKGMQVGGDGAVWAASSTKLLRLEGDGFKEVLEANYSDVGGSIDDFAVTADGQVWVVNYKGVSHHDGRAWSTEEKATIGASDDLLKGVAVDAAGKVWVASSHKVHVRDGGAWKTIDLGKAGRGPLYFEFLELGPEGSVYALHSTALLQIGPAPGKVEKVKLGRSGMSYRSLSLSTNLGLAVADIDAVMSVPMGGALRTYNSRASSYLRSAKINLVAVDDGGRVWVSTEAGLAIVGPGDAKTEWPTGSMPELSGEVRGLLVLGSGPAELPGAGEVRKGGLTGKLLRDGSPFANVEVEICPTPSMIYSKTPCADGEVKVSTRSDDSGVWTASDVPIGRYGIAVKADGKWQVTLGYNIGGGMKEGQVYDTGSLTIDRK